MALHSNGSLSSMPFSNGERLRWLPTRQPWRGVVVVPLLVVLLPVYLAVGLFASAGAWLSDLVDAIDREG